MHYRKQSGQICRHLKQASFPISFFCTTFGVAFSYSSSSFIWLPIVGKRQPILPQLTTTFAKQSYTTYY